MISEYAILKNRVDGEVSEILAPVYQSRTKLFYNMLFVIWTVIAFYTVLFYWLGIAVFWIMAVGTFVFSPITYWFAKIRHMNGVLSLL